MRNDRYVRAQHRRTVLKELEEFLRQRYIVGDGATKQSLICEEAPYVDRNVSQEAFIDVLSFLAQLDTIEKKYLEGYELRERPALPPMKEHLDEPEKKTRRRRRSGGSGPQSSGSA